MMQFVLTSFPFYGTTGKVPGLPVDVDYGSPEGVGGSAFSSPFLFPTRFTVHVKLKTREFKVPFDSLSPPLKSRLYSLLV